MPRGDGKLDLAALEDHCKLHLGKQKRPREIEVVGELPKNFLGKVLRRKLARSASSTRCRMIGRLAPGSSASPTDRG